MGSKLRVRLIVLAVAGLIVIAAIALLAKPVSPPEMAETPSRFDVSSEIVRSALSARWSDPVASGSGTRCREAVSEGSVWRTCDAPMGELLTVSVSAPAFSEPTVRTLLGSAHPDMADEYAAWVQAVARSRNVQACTTAGPLWRAEVDGAVVVGSNGVCRS